MRKRRSFPAVVSIGTVTGQLAPALASVHVKLRTTVGNVAAVVNRFIYCIWPINLKAYIHISPRYWRIPPLYCSLYFKTGLINKA